MPDRYEEPGRVARVGNTVIRWLAEVGVSIAGSRALTVRGRRSGLPRHVVVNVLSSEGVDYLVSPRGQTQWVRNARAAGEVELGPRWARRRMAVTEIADEAKPQLLRRYLARWHWQVKGVVLGLTPESGDSELAAAAPSFPVFALSRY
ncbi:nitroreductase/quinone reductase family protein [Mycolicibacillus trivialis]|uniref:Nitroreductase n=1 Tax=Mycolicibacillus trivialis TaxID=1798 RepID=A0A1X2EML8_9MYCO|nr:nitroreductase/quinone reductase family protein [Mycolicibacillus trivialis]ORX06894.1 hypothetical protein AWC30_04775 [Mycolicibacillus trivialis]